MKYPLKYPLGLIAIASITASGFAIPAIAQVIPDASLGSESSIVSPHVIQGLPSDRIDGGAQRGANLFHSFQEFQVTSGSAVYFSQPTGVGRIITRITGNARSTIDGPIGVLGNADLFFLNPNGIQFGRNARLNLTGSFIGTTANSMQFADGSTLTTTGSDTPLLSVSVPIGLGFGSASAIDLQGRGYVLEPRRVVPLPYRRLDLTQGLSVASRKTLALIGGSVNFTNAIASAASGHLELGSVQTGTVRLSPTTTGWTFDYGSASEVGPITLSGRSLLDVSGSSSGSIQLQGQRITMRDGSLALLQNRGGNASGDLQIVARESVDLIGRGPDETIASGVISETLTAGRGADIQVNAPVLRLQEGALIDSRSIDFGEGGDILVNSDRLIISGASARLGEPSEITARTFAAGRSGSLLINTRQLQAIDAGRMTVGSAGTGAGGDILIRAAESVEVGGSRSGSPSSSFVGTGTFGWGNAGNLAIDTARLWLRDGGRIYGSTGGPGDAGSVAIQASEWVRVEGQSRSTSEPSLIDSSAFIPPPIVRLLYRLAPIPSGDAGNVRILTPDLWVQNGGEIAVRNAGTGNGGSIGIQARTLTLDSDAQISAKTASGEGGNISLDLGKRMVMRRSSEVSSTAQGSGNGGNITIRTPTLILLEASRITANARQGRGGNIDIQTQGLFQSPDSAITATSELGIAGTVSVAGLNFAQDQDLISPPMTFVKSDTIVAGSCLAKRNVSQHRFVTTGTGGLPATPFDTQPANRYAATAFADRLETAHAAVPEEPTKPVPNSASYQEATALVTTPDGRLFLVAEGPEMAEPDAIACP